jgi:hypothetical protein
MKIMLTLFVLSILCSYALSSETETQSTSLVTFQTNKWTAKDSILPNGKKLFSTNGEFSLHMRESDCRLVLQKKNGASIWLSPQVKRRNCFAVLRGTSNFEIMSGNIVVWSTNTAPKFSGKGPYRMYINKKGNPIVKNNENKCVWALYGCPMTSIIQKFKTATPKKKWNIVRRIMRIQKKRRRGLPIRQLPLARGAPIIKNQLPLPLKSQNPPKPLPKLIIKPKEVKRLKALVNNDGEDALDQIKKSLRGIANKKQMRKLTILVNNEATWEQLRKVAVRKAKKLAKKEVKRLKRLDKKVAKQKPKRIRTKKVLIRRILSASWFTQFRRQPIIMNIRRAPRRILIRKKNKNTPRTQRNIKRAPRAISGARRQPRVAKRTRKQSKKAAKKAKKQPRGTNRRVIRQTRAIKRILKKSANIRGNISFFARLRRYIRANRWKKVARLIALPPRSRNSNSRIRKVLTSPIPKKYVNKKRLELYQDKKLVWNWRRTFRGYWQRVCRRWWWRRHCFSVYRRNYYMYRHYYYTTQWKFRWVNYKQLE